MGKIKKPFGNTLWREVTPGVWKNRSGYTLRSLGDVDQPGWRLLDPGGRFLVDQLELFESTAPLTDWADQYIRGLT